jgi:hypothetical protein
LKNHFGVAAVGAVVERVNAPANFFAPAGVVELCRSAQEEVPWEVFHGRLLDAGQTRLRRRFESWHIEYTRKGAHSGERLLSVRLDVAGESVHVTRGVRCRVWEAYDAGSNVILSREVEKPVSELVGTLELASFADLDELAAELTCLVFEAVVGTSRLPLTSVETPLPQFSFGELAYAPRRAAGGKTDNPLRTADELMKDRLLPRLGRREVVKLVEAMLRATPAEELGEVAGHFAERWAASGRPREDLPRLLRWLFEEVALTPYTGFVDNLLGFAKHLVRLGQLSTAEFVDFLSYLLRQVCRHLTAYDLVTFHYRGANYPDMLLLDAALKEYLRQVHDHGVLFTDGNEPIARMRRRALRQAFLMRRRHEGHLVPDEPTSPGENARVLPAPHRRVPDEQIMQPATRTRRLFDRDPIVGHVTSSARAALERSLHDLGHADELRELGMAIFLDRPLGVSKLPGEPDQTLLFSYEAFSRSVAEAALGRMSCALEDTGTRRDLVDPIGEALAALTVNGIPVGSSPSQPARPGVSVFDAARAADDFVFLRTTRRAVGEFLAQFDFGIPAEAMDLSYLRADRRLLIMQGGNAEPGTLRVYDHTLLPRLALRVDAADGYVRRMGREFPAGGLRIVQAWNAAGGAEKVASANAVKAVPPGRADSC